jgi:hypothetical protein
MISPASPSFASSACFAGPSSEVRATRYALLATRYSRYSFTPAEAAEVFHNRPVAPKLIPGQGPRHSAEWSRAYARLRGTRIIFELTRGPLARNRAFRNLGPRWDLEHAERGGPFHGALSHPEFACAFRA